MRLFTSEAVTVGHPDKICDQIADTILTLCLKEDKDSHVACEVCCTTGTVVLMGEISTKAVIDYKQVARDVLRSIGYVNPEYGIDYKSCSVVDLIDKQSPEINSAVKYSLENRSANEEVDLYDTQGAGDQGIIFGYACNETKELMPLSIMLAHDLARQLREVRRHSDLDYLRPDGKTQVSIVYDNEGNVLGIDTILISTQHNPDVNMDTITADIIDKVITPVINKRNIGFYNNVRNYLINPSGSFVVGGPHGDTGLTGRKLAVDTYGGHAKFGGGAMCGKDPSKVDRSAAYMARYIAKHLVAANYANSCEVQISYAIGKARPVSVWVSTNGKSFIPDDVITQIVNKVFDMRPSAIIDKLSLLDFSYNQIAGSCQFGDSTCPWEKLDGAIMEELASYKTKYMQSYME